MRNKTTMPQSIKRLRNSSHVITYVDKIKPIIINQSPLSIYATWNQTPSGTSSRFVMADQFTSIKSMIIIQTFIRYISTEN